MSRKHWILIIKRCECIFYSYQSEKQALQSFLSLKKIEHRYTKYEIELAYRIALTMKRRPTVKGISDDIEKQEANRCRTGIKAKHRNVDTNYDFTRRASYFGGKNKC